MMDFIIFIMSLAWGFCVGLYVNKNELRKKIVKLEKKVEELEDRETWSNDRYDE
jgi:hypothetical protein